MQINRLFEIVYLLMDKKSMTAKELASHFEMSVRTILRDIDTLAMAGIPIYTTQGKGGGVRLMDGFVLNKSLLTDKEQSDILSALQSLHAVNVPDVEPVLTKLAALFNKNTTSWIDIDFSPWDSSDTERDKFIQLKNAILLQKLVTFDYFSFWGEKSHRTVEPLQIVFKEKAWYLSAFCREKNDYRTFKLGRIKNLELAEQVFEPRPLRKIAESFATNNLCPVTIKVDEDLSSRVWDEHEPNNVTENDDGSFTVKAIITNDEWGYGYIMSYGANAEVLEPLYIRELIKKRFSEAANKYL